MRDRTSWSSTLALAAALVAGLAPLGVARAEPAAAPEALTLEQAIELALAKTRESIHARDDVLLADAARMQALAPILPQVDLTLGADAVFTGPSSLVTLTQEQRAVAEAFGQTFDGESYASLQLQLSGRQLLWDGGRWWAVIARAKAGSEQAKAALAGVEADVRLAVVRRFYELVKAQRAAATFEQQVAIDQEQLARVRAVLEAGRGKLADVAAVERNLAEDRITLARRKAAVRSASHALNVALGWVTDAPVKPSEPASILSDEVSEGTAIASEAELAAAARKRRPELAVVRAQLDAAERSVDIAKAEYWPKVALHGSYSRSSREVGRFFGNPGEDYVAALGLGLSWNIFQGRGTDAAVETAELNLHKQRASASAQEVAILNEVGEKRDAVILLADVLLLAREAVRAGDEAVRLARGLYEAGKGTLLELRDAELKLTLERLAVSEARIDLEIAREELRRAVGGDLGGATSSDTPSAAPRRAESEGTP